MMQDIAHTQKEFRERKSIVIVTLASSVLLMYTAVSHNGILPLRPHSGYSSVLDSLRLLLLIFAPQPAGKEDYAAFHALIHGVAWQRQQEQEQRASEKTRR